MPSRSRFFRLAFIAFLLAGFFGACYAEILPDPRATPGDPHPMGAGQLGQLALPIPNMILPSSSWTAASFVTIASAAPSSTIPGDVFSLYGSATGTGSTALSVCLDAGTSCAVFVARGTVSSAGVLTWSSAPQTWQPWGWYAVVREAGTSTGLTLYVNGDTGGSTTTDGGAGASSPISGAVTILNDAGIPFGSAATDGGPALLTYDQSGLELDTTGQVANGYLNTINNSTSTIVQTIGAPGGGFFDTPPAQALQIAGDDYGSPPHFRVPYVDANGNLSVLINNADAGGLPIPVSIPTPVPVVTADGGAVATDGELSIVASAIGTSGSAPPAGVVMLGGKNGALVEPIKTDLAGDVFVQMGTASNFSLETGGNLAKVGSTVLATGSAAGADTIQIGCNASGLSEQPICDASNRIVVVGAGTAGVPAGGVESVNIVGSSTVPVSGTVTANQGTAAAIASAWPTEITDGTNILGTLAHPVIVTDTRLPAALGLQTAANSLPVIIAKPTRFDFGTTIPAGATLVAAGSGRWVGGFLQNNTTTIQFLLCFFDGVPGAGGVQIYDTIVPVSASSLALPGNSYPLGISYTNGLYAEVATTAAATTACVASASPTTIVVANILTYP